MTSRLSGERANFTVRLSLAERRLLEAAAARQDETLGEYLRRVATARAHQDIDRDAPEDV
jgi:uncharacterized protein (DUF1778 family)